MPKDKGVDKWRGEKRGFAGFGQRVPDDPKILCLDGYALESVTVTGYKIEGSAPPPNTWVRTDPGLGPMGWSACVGMADALPLGISLTRVGGSVRKGGTLRLVFKLSCGDVEKDCVAFGTAGDTVEMKAEIQDVVPRTVGCYELEMSAPELSWGSDRGGWERIVLEDSQVIKFIIYTMYGPPLDDNVTDNRMLPPGREADPRRDEVARFSPFYTPAHIQQAVAWARGAGLEGTHGGTKVIADTVVERIPEITYADWSQNPDDYCDTYVGWNVWDHPGTRTADCSQLASFFADVLGVLGVRAHDFEIKWEREVSGDWYRRDMGVEDGETYACHAVLLVRYMNEGLTCYDTRG